MDEQSRERLGHVITASGRAVQREAGFCGWCSSSSEPDREEAGGSKKRRKELESVGCAVHGSWCTRLSGYGGGCTEVRDSKRFVHHRVEPSSFVVVRVLASESALSAAGPCV